MLLLFLLSRTPTFQHRSSEGVLLLLSHAAAATIPLSFNTPPPQGVLLAVTYSHSPPRGVSLAESVARCFASTQRLSFSSKLVAPSLSRACRVPPWRGFPLGASLLPKHVSSPESWKLLQASVSPESLAPESFSVATVAVRMVEQLPPCRVCHLCSRRQASSCAVASTNGGL